jgi:hypothetical protein
MPSYYEALPIYKVAMDVALRVDAVVQRFGKGHGYTLGGRLRETTLDVVMLVARLIERGLAQGLTVGVALEEPEACGNVKGRRLALAAHVPRRGDLRSPSGRQCPRTGSNRVVGRDWAVETCRWGDRRSPLHAPNPRLGISF